MNRRHALRVVGAASLGAASWVSCAAVRPAAAIARVVVVGGGFGGATAARYLRRWSQQRLEVVMVEPAPAFVSCPMSNLVLGGQRSLDSVTLSYEPLVRRQGVIWRRDRVTRIDPGAHQLTLAAGDVLRYDKLLLSPGVSLRDDEIDGLRAAHAQGRIVPAWKAGAETVALRRQLEDMPDGGVLVISVPEAPYRCPPGPYERACVVAAYFKRAKPRAKVLILDANPDVTSKPALFKQAWAELYPGMVEHRPLHKVIGVDGATVRLELHDDVRGDVLNLLPPMQAHRLAADSGLMNAGRWCDVHWRTFESTAARDVVVLGDAVRAANAMPKSAHMANAHAKVAAAALVAEWQGQAPPDAPMLTNTCYSHVSDDSAIHVASVHAYQASTQTFEPVPGAGGLSAERSAAEAVYADAWARNIWADALG